MKMYLSPSKQPRNSYAVGNTNEQAQMEELTKMVQSKLGSYEVDVKMASLHLQIGNTGRSKEASNLKCDIYEAYHTNAGGGGKAKGAVVFYNPKFPISKTLAENIVAELNAISPHGENRAAQVVDGMALYDGAGASEIRTPGEFGIPAVLIEVDFHDNPVTARYIIDNKSKIADAIVRANAKTFGLQVKEDVKLKPKVEENSKGLIKVIYDGKDGLNTRKTADFDDNVDHVVFAGEVFTVVGMVGDFYKLKSGLYISNNPKFVEFTEAPEIKSFKVLVTANVLNIREGAGISSKIVGTVRKGDAYTIVNKINGWGELKSGAGWISLDFTEVLK